MRACNHTYDCGGVKRFWTYPRYEWEPRRRWLPSIGGDEHDQRTIVLPIPFAGWLVVALWTVRHPEWCVEVWSHPADPTDFRR